MATPLILYDHATRKYEWSRDGKLRSTRVDMSDQLVVAQHVKHKALQLRVRRYTFQQISEELGVSYATAANAVRAALAEQREEIPVLARRMLDEDLLELELMLERQREFTYGPKGDGLDRDDEPISRKDMLAGQKEIRETIKLRAQLAGYAGLDPDLGLGGGAAGQYSALYEQIFLEIHTALLAEATFQERQLVHELFKRLDRHRRGIVPADVVADVATGPAPDPGRAVQQAAGGSEPVRVHEAGVAPGGPGPVP